MTVAELMRALMELSPVQREETCDRLIAGDETRTLTKVCVCFKATADVIARAARAGAELLIAHEPVFYGSESREGAAGDEIALTKWRLIDETGISIYRFHDYAHEIQPDFIHDGFLRALGLSVARAYPRDSLGVSRYALQTPVSPLSIASLISEKLSVEHPRMVGDLMSPVRVVCLGLGAVGVTQMKLLVESDADLFITGEIGEVYGCEYVRDAAYFGKKKSLMLLGHCGAEYAGMRLLAAYIDERFLPADYIHCGEVFHYMH